MFEMEEIDLEFGLQIFEVDTPSGVTPGVGKCPRLHGCKQS